MLTWLVAFIRRWRNLFFRLGIVLGLILFLQQGWQGVQALNQHKISFEQPIYVFMAFLMLFVAHVMQLLAWAQIMRGLGTIISVPDILKGYMISFLPRYIPGTVWGYLSRGEWLKSELDIPYTKSIFGSVLEAGLIVLTGGVFIISYYFWCWTEISKYILILFSFSLFTGGWYTFNWVLPMFRLIRQTGFVSKPIISFRSWINVCLMYLGLWIFYGMSLSFLQRSIEYNSSIWENTFVFCIAWIVGFLIIFVPAGLGVRELTLSGLLVYLTSLNSDVANTIAVTLRVLIYFVEIVLVVIGIIFTQRRICKKPQIKLDY